MSADELIPLSRLEAELGISRVDLLLLIRRFALEPVRRGMRTYLSRDDASTLISRAGGDSAEAVAAELVVDDSPLTNLPVPAEAGWYKAELYAELRLFRERLEILERLMRTGIELDSSDLADLLQLKRLPSVENQDGQAFFDRQGLRFWRMNRPGQRSSWRVTTIPAS